MISNGLKKSPNETELQYIWRVGKMRENGVITLSWKELADVFNAELREPDEQYTESAYRKKYALVKQAYDEIFSEIDDAGFANDLVKQKQEIQKERRKLYDERLDINRRLREEARLETTIEKLEASLQNVAKNRYSDVSDIYLPQDASDDVMVICLSDLHIGACFDNFDGAYSPEIADARLRDYLVKIRGIQNRNGCKECVVTLLGDEISGSIHKTISVTNKEDVVDQVKTASMLIADFVDVLSHWFDKVRVYSVSGNHSRIEKKAEDALLSERLDKLIPWFLEVLMRGRDNVKIFSNTFDDTLGIFEIGSQTYFIQHGDYTAITDAAIGKLVLWAKKTPYCILTGHMHYPAMTNISGIYVVQSGSLCGSGDEFTRSKRLTGEPSQTVLVTNYDGKIKGIYPVEL